MRGVDDQCPLTARTLRPGRSLPGTMKSRPTCGWWSRESGLTIPRGHDQLRLLGAGTPPGLRCGANPPTSIRPLCTTSRTGRPARVLLERASVARLLVLSARTHPNSTMSCRASFVGQRDVLPHKDSRLSVVGNLQRRGNDGQGSTSVDAELIHNGNVIGGGLRRPRLTGVTVRPDERACPTSGFEQRG